MMEPLHSLDAHAHIDPSRPSAELLEAGAVFAMTFSLEEALQVLGRTEPAIAWGVGCHPRKPEAQDDFRADRFGELIEQTAIVGEVGLDGGSRVPMEQQLHTLRQVLTVVAEHPRLTSLHSNQATRLLLSELRLQPILTPVLHWWTGNLEETREAVALGCYFSVHPAVARQAKFHTAVPPERLLVESDLSWSDPPAAIPCRVEWVEHLLAAQLKCSQQDVRQLAWRNFARIIEQTGTRQLLPPLLAEMVTHQYEKGAIPPPGTGLL